jgi:formylglycine-generating enzyme required for sulfatase activity
MTDNLPLVIILPLCRVPEFEASKYLVSNREFHEFVKDGGYQRKELWTEEGNAMK